MAAPDRAHRWATGLRSARRTGALHLFLALLLPIPFLLVFHQLYFWDVPPFSSPRWAVNEDRSFIEVYGYVQLAVAALLLLSIGVRRRRGPAYLGWAAALVVVVLDDALRLHELGGGLLVRRGLVPDVLGLPAQALGELVVWALIGVPVLLLVGAAHWASPRPARADSWRLAALTLVLIAFGVGFDLVHEVIEEITDNSVVDLLATFVETVGELVPMTALLACALHLARTRGAVR